MFGDENYTYTLWSVKPDHRYNCSYVWNINYNIWNRLCRGQELLEYLGHAFFWIVLQYIYIYFFFFFSPQQTYPLSTSKSGFCNNRKNWTELHHRYHNSRNFYIISFLLCVCKTVKKPCIIHRIYNFPNMYILVSTSNKIRLMFTLIYMRPGNNQHTVFWDVMPHMLVKR